MKTQEKIDKIKEQIQSLEYQDSDAVEQYESMLDDAYGTVSIAGMEFTTSRALKELDPIAYKVGFNEFTSRLIRDLEEELSGLVDLLKEDELEDVNR